jgi:uncharacterized protein (DUF885 family)
VIELHLEDEIEVGKSFVDDISDEFVGETQAIERVILDAVREKEEPGLAHDVYEWWLDDRVRRQMFSDLEYRVTPSVNSVPLNTELFFTEAHPLETAEDAENYVRRLWSAGDKILALAATLERLESAGIVAPRPLTELARQHIADVAASNARDTPYFDALASRLPADARRALLDDAANAIEDSILPAYHELAELLLHLVMIGSEEVGVWQHPNGDAYYSWALRHHVTADVTPDELHQLGLDELTRIHAELEARFLALGYPANESLLEKIGRVIVDGGVVPRERVVAEYEAIIRDAESRVSEAFDLFPSATVVVKGVPAGGFYVPASLDGSRPGAFFATVAGGGEPRFGMRTLAYHEAVPGHHFAIGIAQDLDLPLFRRVAGFTGFDEGWALYAEWLAGELGWYEGDEFGDIGRLQAEAFRAARLVVDTGIHSKHWSLDQAIEFMEENVGFSRGAATGQIIRYASWPGQATAYYTGRTRIIELRQSAQQALGDQFDEKVFHHAVLSHGSMPLFLIDLAVREDLSF